MCTYIVCVCVVVFVCFVFAKITVVAWEKIQYAFLKSAEFYNFGIIDIEITRIYFPDPVNYWQTADRVLVTL